MILTWGAPAHASLLGRNTVAGGGFPVGEGRDYIGVGSYFNLARLWQSDD